MAGRRPRCSRPLVGSKSIHMMSPASGQKPSPDFVADGGAPLGLGVAVLLGDRVNQRLQKISAPLLRLCKFDDEGAILDRHVGAPALARADLLGKGARNPQRQAV